MRFSKRIDTPSSETIYSSGFISPDGVPYSMGDTRHGDWALMYYNWLESKGFHIDTPPNFDPDKEWNYDMSFGSGRQSDAIRDELVRQGWIHVFAPELLSVWRFDFATEEKIKKAYRDDNIHLDDWTDAEIKVIEQSTDKTHYINLKQSEESIFASRKFSFRDIVTSDVFKIEQQPEQGVIMRDGWISPEGDTYPMPNGSYHSGWIKQHLTWLQNKYNFEANMSTQELDDLDVDYLRNKLIQDKGWIRVVSQGGDTYFSVRNYSEALPKILNVISSELVDANPEIIIYDQNTKKTVEFPLQDVERQLAFASRRFSIREARFSGIKFWVSPEGEFYSWNSDEITGGSESTHHAHKILELTNQKLNFPQAQSQGWVSGGNINGSLYLRVNSAQEAQDALRKIPKEYRLAKYFLIGLGNDDVNIPMPYEDALMSLNVYIRDNGLKSVARLSIRDAAAVIKFWFHPETGQMIKLDRWDIHAEKAPDQYVSKNSATDSLSNEEDTLKNMYKAGWVRGALNYREELDLNVGFDKNESYIQKTLEKLPSEFLFVKNLVVDYGGTSDLSGEKAGVYGNKTIPVDEGEDALSAWKNRNSVRKMVAKFSKRDANSNFKFWLSPEGEIKKFSVDEEHSAHNSTKSINELLRDGWVRGELYSGKKQDLCLNLYDESRVLWALQHLPLEMLFVDEILVDIGDFSSRYSKGISIDVDEDETAIEAWKNRNSIRKTVNAQQIQELPSYEDVSGWLSPDGKFYPLHGATYHGQWVVEHYEWLVKVKHVSLPPYAELKRDSIQRGSDYVRNILVEQGWIHVYSSTMMSVNSFSSQEQKIIDYVLTGGHHYDKNDEIEIYELSRDRWINMSYSKLLGLDDEVTASIRLSSRDAIKDTIEYWDKAKNKDFSKYWRQLRRKKRKSNYVPNPKSTMPSPIKKNYDYGEIPNWIDRVEWHEKKEEREKRKANLNFIIEASLVKTAYIVEENGEYCVKSEKGKNLGCSKSRAGAEKRLRQVEYFKHKG